MNIQYQRVSSQCYGIISLGEDHSEQNSFVIKKGQRIPCSITETFYTVSEGQTGLQIRITATSIDEKDPTYATIIGEGRLELPPGRPAGQPIEVTFDLHEISILRCHFKDVETGEARNVTDVKGVPPSNSDPVMSVMEVRS